MSVTALDPLEGRSVVRCDHCELVQFPAASGRCRRCLTPYVELPAAPAPLPRWRGCTLSAAPVALLPLEDCFAEFLSLLRAAIGISQTQFMANARRRPEDRTRVYEMERARCATPRMVQMAADGLGLPAWRFVQLLEADARGLRPEEVVDREAALIELHGLLPKPHAQEVFHG